MANLDLLEELGELMEDLTTSGSPSLKPELMKGVKRICKSSDIYVKHAYHIVMTQLKKKHAEVRLSAFQIIDELFQRSHIFRELLIDDFQQFLELTAETDFKQPLPPPTNVAKTLMENSYRAVESWHQKFGSHYKNLDLGFKYLKRTKHAELESLRATSIAERQRADERERRKQNALRKRLVRVETQMSETVWDMERCLTERESCFKLLLPHPKEYEIFDTPEGARDDNNRGDNRKECSTYNEGRDSDARNQEKEPQPGISSQFESNERISSDEPQGILSRHGLGTRSYRLSIDLSSATELTIHESDDNSVILDKLRESNKEVTHKYLPMINKWLSVLSKCDGMQQKIQQVIDVKRALEASRDKFLELRVVPMEKLQEKAVSQSSSFVITEGSEDENSSDEFEDVPEMEGLEAFNPKEKSAEYSLEPLTSTSTQYSTLSQEKSADTNDGIKSSYMTHFEQKSDALADPTSRERALLEMRRRLLPGPSATHTSTSDSQTPTTEEGNSRQKLLQEAPVLPFDVDLCFWGDSTAGTHKIIKSNIGNNYWASKDDEELVVEGEKGGHQKRTMTFAGKFEPVKWACRAPLPSGQLCPRRDRFKCPFHGKIVARDQMGCPVDPDDAPTDGMSSGEGATVQADWQEIQQDIEAATGLDLGSKKGRKRTTRLPKEGEKLTQKQKYSRLTDVRKNKHTSRARLEEKVLDPKAMRRVAEDLNAIASKKQQEKFGNQFNYAMRK